ncbi:MAG TPA: hypothetical protein VG406_11710 [Isosphaeraceae bacterium]|jgi:hypothetical protein|nr:hypothetical protein [Isosphaeraceae bacterium]
MPRSRGDARRAALLAALLCAAAGGCLGPAAVRSTRLRYNEVVRSTNDEQLLINIVRLRYADSPVFIDLPTITSQFEAAAGGSYPGKAGSQTAFGVAGLTARDTPTLSYHPREGREIAKALLTPLSADLFNVIHAGADVEQLLLLTLNDINDVPNAPRATVLAPQSPDDNAEFRRGLRIIVDLQERDAIELAVGTTETADGASDPISAGSLKGADLLGAAKDGYVYRARGGDRVTLLRREKGLVLHVRPPFVGSPEMLELARALRLTPGLRQYRIKSELAEDGDELGPRPIDDTIYLNMRSIMQIMIFMAKGVCVPAGHVAAGVAPTTPGPGGRPYDWTRVTAGHFFVHSGPRRPRDPEVAVKYRGSWFWVARDDVSSRAALAVLEVLFALQESEDKAPSPLLTLPLGGG